MPANSTTIEQISKDASWFPNRYDVNAGNLEMIKTDCALLADTTFLATPNFPPKDIVRKIVPASSLSSISNTSTPSFIFHSAFCCSTLIARAINFPSKVRSLKEPQITMDIADHIRRTGDLPKHIGLVSKLLSRTVNLNEKTVIKPTNMVNNILLFDSDLITQSPILFLYGSLRGFLVSTLKKGEQGRFMIRRMYSIFMKDPTRFKEIPLQQVVTLTDLQITAMVWLLQTEIFEERLLNCSNGLMASLHCDDFLAQSMGYLASINQHLKLDLGDKDLFQLYRSDILNLDSKQQDKSYNSKKRKTESKQIEDEYGPTLDHICNWADGLSLHGKIQHKLARPIKPLD